MKKIIILLSLSFSLQSSSFDTQTFLTLPSALQKKIIEYSEINQCFSMNNEEYEKVFQFLSRDYYLEHPYAWTKKELERAQHHWYYEDNQEKIKKELSYQAISKLASWLDAAMHCFFYNEAMDLIVASECRKIRNGQTKIGNFNNPNFFEQLSFAKSTTYQSFNANIKKIFKEKFEERLPKYIPYIQPIPLPLKPYLNSTPLDESFTTQSDIKIELKTFFSIALHLPRSFVITDYHWGLKNICIPDLCYIYLNCNNFPNWFFIKDKLDFDKTNFNINITNKTISYNQNNINFLNINELNLQQILLLQKIYYYATHKKNVSFNREDFTESFKLFIPSIILYPIAHQFTPQYKLIQEWHKITENEKNKQVGKHIINQAVHIPTCWKILNYSFYQYATYAQIINSMLIIYIGSIIKQYLQYNIFSKKVFIGVVFCYILQALFFAQENPYPADSITINPQEITYTAIENLEKE